MNLDEMEKLYSQITDWHGDRNFLSVAREFVPWAIKRIRKLERVAEAAKNHQTYPSGVSMIAADDIRIGRSMILDEALKELERE